MFLEENALIPRRVFSELWIDCSIWDTGHNVCVFLPLNLPPTQSLSFNISEEEDIAFYEENTRDFLFPEPKRIPTYAGVERELLMRTNSSFPVSCYETWLVVNVHRDPLAIN